MHFKSNCSTFQILSNNKDKRDREKMHNFIEIQNLYNLYIYYSIYIYSFTSLKIHVDIEDSHNWAGENKDID
jgi:hypothetical protein